MVRGDCGNKIVRAKANSTCLSKPQLSEIWNNLNSNQRRPPCFTATYARTEVVPLANRRMASGRPQSRSRVYTPTNGQNTHQTNITCICDVCCATCSWSRVRPNEDGIGLSTEVYNPGLESPLPHTRLNVTYLCCHCDIFQIST